MTVVVETPRLNANEDQALVVQVLVREGDAVVEGAPLFVLETTKAASEVHAPCAGRVGKIRVNEGEYADVGAPLCTLAPDNAGAVTVVSDAGAAEHGDARISAKARRKAAELGVDPDLVPAIDGRVTVQAVLDYAARRHPAAALHPLSIRAMDAVVIGGGGHAATVIDALQGTGYNIVGCLDANLAVGTEVVSGVRVIGTDDMLDQLLRDGIATAFIGIGGVANHGPRQRVFERFRAAGFSLPPVVARTAHLGLGATLGAASIVMPGAVVGPRVSIGVNVVVNSGAVICHDCVVGDHCHFTPGAILAGNIRVGASTTVGMAATVLFGTTIGQGCLIHNNASVVGELSDNFEFTAEGKRLRRT